MNKGLPEQKLATWDEFLALEGESEERYEFHDGEIVAMAGASPTHAYLSVRWSSALMSALDGRPCRVFDSALLVAVPQMGRGFHPDVSVVCGPLQRTEGDDRGVLNPGLIVEVLSPSTERFDRGEKFLHYQQIATLQCYVLVSQHRALVEVYTRAGDGWLYNRYGPGMSIRLAPLGVEIDLDRIYRGAFEIEA